MRVIIPNQYLCECLFPKTLLTKNEGDIFNFSHIASWNFSHILINWNFCLDVRNVMIIELGPHTEMVRDIYNHLERWKSHWLIWLFHIKLKDRSKFHVEHREFPFSHTSCFLGNIDVINEKLSCPKLRAFFSALTF